MRICYDCQSQIHRHDKWKIDGSRIRHINCSNPRLIQEPLPLWKPFVLEAPEQQDEIERRA